MIGRNQKAIYSASYASDTSYLAYPKDYRQGQGTRHVIVGCHGHGGYSYQYAPASAAQPGYHTPYLVDTSGYVMMGVDHSTIDSWGDGGTMVALDELYTWLTGTLGMPTTKIAFQGWSMGGLAALNWIMRNPTKVAGAWLWAPATDMRYYRDGSGAYTPTYSVGAAGALQGTYNAELGTVYGASTTAVGTATIPASGGAGVTVTVANAKEFSDSLIFGGSSTAQATASGVAFTYTGKTTTTLTGCVSTTAGTIAITNGLAITSVYATQSTQYNPWSQAAGFTTGAGFTFPIKIAHATNDDTVPADMSNHASTGFAARTGNANITLRTPQITTGNHSGVINQVTSAELAAFYDGLSW